MVASSFLADYRAAAAEREALSPQGFVRAAVGEFSRNADPDEWTLLMTRLRDCDDPAAACLEMMIERRLALEEAHDDRPAE